MQVEGESLDTQTRQIQSYAVSRGWSVLDKNIFVEAGVSGGTDFQDRPEGQKLIASAQKGDVIVFTKLDRAFRNVRNAFNTLHQLKELGINVHFLDLGGEVTGNGVGAIVFAVMSSFASFERERIATRIREVKQFQKAQGKFLGGRRAFGHTIVDGKKCTNNDEQLIIDEMKTLRSSGQSYRSIAVWLATKNVRLSAMGVRSVLNREAMNA
jgi:DNA invertase Pin-like site-specific DNA recombinase